MIAIMFEGNYGGIKLDEIPQGNPGIGGSEYLLLQLFYYLGKDMPVLLLSTDSRVVGNNMVYVRNDMEAVKMATELGCEVFIFIPKERGQAFYTILNQSGLKAVAWVHNYISYKVIDYLENCNAVKRVVFVGRQHYDAYIDTELIGKATYIYNMVKKSSHERQDIASKENIVTYVGALIPTKGFHKLAKNWKKVLKKVPDAQLYVVGSGALYDRTSVLGKWGLAEAGYEKKFMRYLTDEHQIPLKSVHFMGHMGAEKEELLTRTKVGVANPTGKSETFCLSAVEYKAYGVPVISYRGYGLLDTVHDEKDGLLVKSSKELTDAIVRLLTDNAENTRLADYGYQVTSQEFDTDVIIPKWKKLLQEVRNNEPCTIQIPDSYWSDDFKRIKYINYKIKKKWNGHWKSVSYCISYVKEWVKRCLSR